MNDFLELTQGLLDNNNFAYKGGNKNGNTK